MSATFLLKKKPPQLSSELAHIGVVQLIQWRKATKEKEVINRQAQSIFLLAERGVHSIDGLRHQHQTQTGE